MPTIGMAIPDIREPIPLAADIAARSQPNSAPIGLMKRPKLKSVIGACATSIDIVQPNTIHHRLEKNLRSAMKRSPVLMSRNFGSLAENSVVAPGALLASRRI